MRLELSNKPKWIRRRLIACAILVILTAPIFWTQNKPDAPEHNLPRVAVHPSGHFLQTDDGRPFFSLADTAWELIHHTTREECSYYLHTRSRQGFTLIQMVVLSEFEGITQPSALGEKPFTNNDPKQPNEKYFERVVE